MITDELKKILPEDRIKTRQIDLVSYAADAGFYYLLPKAVVRPVNETEVAGLFKFSQAAGIPLVFRTGGTSLSGQSITDGVLVDLSRFWNRITIEEEGNRVRVQPGITGAMVNARLKQFKRKIGPDPSSINAAMMGGILSNNASGMCCGVQLNSYHTTRYIRFMLTNGLVFSTEINEDYDRFLAACKHLADELTAIRQEITANSGLYEMIRRKYQTKNTVGYSLNAFIDYTHPLDIFAHLLIGGEGTLAFISEAVLDTVPDEPCKTTALLYFPDISAACKAILPLKESGAAMVELMDRASLRAVEHLPGMDPLIKTLPEPASALLIEFQQSTVNALTSQVNQFLAGIGELQLLNAPSFTSDPAEMAFLWKVRKGLFPAVGAVRASGSTVILEDLAFPLETIGPAILGLQELFKKHGYDNGIIFGHAKDGNIHFVVTQSFNTTAAIERYDRFLREVVDLVVNKYHGTLKAEHGTGRNMAPFVETEWGGDAYRIMLRIKAAVDPLSLLNPGVIINGDKAAHIRNLKELPTVEEEVDRCIECGYCEPVCPSRNITLTPRRRIVARRILAGLKAAGNTAAYRLLLKEYQYDGLDTCAVDGLCANACPVDINTGDLVKRLRRESHSGMANRLALLSVKHFGFAARSVRAALYAGAMVNRIAGKKAMQHLTKTMRKMVPAFPLWSDQLVAPPDLAVLHQQEKAPDALNGKTVIYFPACITRLLGGQADGKKNIMETFMEVAAKGGVHVKVLDNVQHSCCGQIYSSKGFGGAYSFAANKIVRQLWESTKEGLYPVVMDVSSCTHTLHHLRPALLPENQSRFDRIKIIDSIDFLHDMILPVCTAGKKKDNIVLHPVCSLKKMGTEDKLRKVAGHFARRVTVPLQSGCCGMAGDRGFLFPELTASAAACEAGEVKAAAYDGYYSSTKTCEMAMSAAVGKNYESILYLVNEAM